MSYEIKIITEILDNDKWRYVPEFPKSFDDFSRLNFAILGNVRGEEFCKIKRFKPKGLPKDISETKFRFNSIQDVITKRYLTETVEVCVCPDGSFLETNDRKLLKEISKEDYNAICNSILFSDLTKKRYRYPKRFDRNSVTGYSVCDADIVGGYFEEFPIRVVFQSFSRFAKEKYSKYYEENKMDYGEYDVDFSNKSSYNSHSFLTLKELEDYDTAPLLNLYDKEHVLKFTTGVEQLEEIAQKYNVPNPEHIRIVFCFYNL